MTLFSSTFRSARGGILASLALLPALLVAACSGQGNTMTAPSGTGGSTLAKPGPAGAPPAGNPDATVLTFANYTSATQTVDVNTTTTSDLGQPYIDQGKIQIEVWVNTSGKPAQWSSGATGTWVRVDQWPNGGKNPVSGLTSTPIDLDNLASLSTTDAILTDAACGDTISFRAHYVTGGGQTHVDTHFSSAADITLTGCVCTTTYSQGYWKNHPQAWPVTSLTLGTRSYTQAELISILSDTSNNGNGLVILSIQLIAAKLNRALPGSQNTNNVDAQIAAADALIGSQVVPPVGSDWVPTNTVQTIKDALEAYNLSCETS